MLCLRLSKVNDLTAAEGKYHPKCYIMVLTTTQTAKLKARVLIFLGFRRVSYQLIRLTKNLQRYIEHGFLLTVAHNLHVSVSERACVCLCVCVCE